VETHLLLSDNNFATYRSFLLSTFPLSDVPTQFHRYLGDYIELRANGRTSMASSRPGTCLTDGTSEWNSISTTLLPSDESSTVFVVSTCAGN